MVVTQALAEKPKPARPAGRPKSYNRPVTPGVLEKIGELWLQGVTKAKIGEQFGIHPTTVRYHIENTIRPLWREDMRSCLTEDLARVALLERTAWERFESSGPSETHKQIEKALLEGGGKPQIVKQVSRKITKKGDMGWLQVVQWCIEFRAKVHGYYQRGRHVVEDKGDLRVAGRTPAEVDDMMLRRLMEKIAERRQYEQAVGLSGNRT